MFVSDVSGLTIFRTRQLLYDDVSLIRILLVFMLKEVTYWKILYFNSLCPFSYIYGRFPYKLTVCEIDSIKRNLMNFIDSLGY